MLWALNILYLQFSTHLNKHKVAIKKIRWAQFISYCLLVGNYQFLFFIYFLLNKMLDFTKYKNMKTKEKNEKKRLEIC